MPVKDRPLTDEHKAAISEAKLSQSRQVREMHAIILSMDKRLTQMERLLRQRTTQRRAS